MAALLPVTPAFQNAAKGYFNEERQGVTRLQADVARAKTVLN